MPSNIRAPNEYSTNPNTIKARRRKMSLNGAKKVEDAARTADYKAMIYARKVIQVKPEYKAATDGEKSAMLEKAMRDTMAKRRARGQDTMSKMAAFNAGLYQDRSSTSGPQTRVPISAFLEDNGFVPLRPSRKSGSGGGNRDSIDGATFDPLKHVDSGSRDPITPMSFGSAPEADMTGAGNAFARTNGLSPLNNTQREGSVPVNVFSPNDRHVEIPAQPRHSPGLFLNQNSSTAASADAAASHVETKVKVSDTPAPFARMTPDLMLPSIEGLDQSFSFNGGEGGGNLAMLRGEVMRLHSMCQSAVRSNSNIRDVDLRNVWGEVGEEKKRVGQLERRVEQLDGVVHALKNTSVEGVVGRLEQLEKLVEELRAKVGCGADAEVAKMREVMGCMREALQRVDGFM